MIQKKVCLVGAFAVGKTSLARRFVQGIFSERYHTTVGVKIDRRVVDVDGRALTMLVWDIAGEDEFQTVRTTYLRGSSGFLFVADGTRSATLSQAVSLFHTARDTVGEVPCALALNKRDLTDAWELDDSVVAGAARHGWAVFPTSAKSGDRVDEAFQWLAGEMLRA